MFRQQQLARSLGGLSHCIQKRPNDVARSAQTFGNGLPQKYGHRCLSIHVYLPLLLISTAFLRPDHIPSPLSTRAPHLRPPKFPFSPSDLKDPILPPLNPPATPIQPCQCSTPFSAQPRSLPRYLPPYSRLLYTSN